MNISIRKRQAYSEIVEILNKLDNEQKEKIPVKLRKFFEEEKDDNYTKRILLNRPLSKQNLKRETLVVLAILNLKYWADEQEKNQLEEKYRINEMNYQKELENKYDIDDIFNNPIREKDLKSNKPIKLKKHNIFEKLINFFGKFFCKERRE